MTSFWNVAKTKRRNGDVVVDNSSETFHRFLFSVFSRNSFSTDRRYRTEDSSACATTPLPPLPPLLGPSSFRPSTVFPERDRTQGPRHPRSRPKLVTTFFLSKVEFLFFQQTTEKEVKIVVSFGFGLDIFSGGRRHPPEPRPFKSFGALRTFFMADCRDARWLLRSDADKPNL